jgi:two-component system, OmpR family, sensor kinase
MINRSIRFKIIFWFVLSVAAILLCFGFLVYSSVRTDLYNDVDDILELKAQGVVDYISGYWKAKNPRSDEAFIKNFGADFVESAESWVETMPEDLELADIKVTLYDASGITVAASQDAYAHARLPREFLDKALQGKSLFYSLTRNVNASGLEHRRMLIVPFKAVGKVICMVGVEKPLNFTDVTLWRLRSSMISFFIISLALVFFTGFFLSRVILRPLDRIVNTMRRITSRNLSERIENTGPRDEISRLSDTFNHMLSELEKSFSAQKRIVEDVSHELRTPLTIIRGEMEVALKRVRSSEEYKSVVQSSLEEVNRISRIVEHLLLLARFDSHAVKLDFERISLSELINDILGDINVLIRQKTLSVKPMVEKDLFVNADRLNLRRAILNILDNAVKYTSEGGVITVSLHKDVSGIALAVKDTGIGIAKEDLGRIFDRFYRADSSRSKQGFGLGLSLARTIFNVHTAQITVSSELGEGTTVTVIFPPA